MARSLSGRGYPERLLQTWEHYKLRSDRTTRRNCWTPVDIGTKERMV